MRMNPVLENEMKRNMRSMKSSIAYNHISRGLFWNSQSRWLSFIRTVQVSGKVLYDHCIYFVFYDLPFGTWNYRWLYCD